MQSGIININKEAGFTSFDVVAKLRGILHIKKIGHTGTLDPQATGVLPICIGKATKVCSLLTDTDKTYTATMLLGQSTDTYDVFGNVTEKREVTTTPEEVQRVIDSFVGETEQIPPMYSAIKINGKKLYELARQGKVVERKPRRVTIYNEETLSIELPRVKFKVDCSKGTYIRSLCNDIGNELGTLGCMEELVRNRVGNFRLEDSYKISDIEKMMSEGTIGDAIIPIDKVFEKHPKRCVVDTATKLCINGAKLKGSDLVETNLNEFIQVSDTIGLPNKPQRVDCEDNLYRLYLSDGSFVGVYRKEGDTYSPEKMFYESV